MRYSGMPAGMWILFAGSFREKLREVFGYTGEEAAETARKAKPEYRKLISRLPEFEKADRFKMNIVNCAMLSSFILAMKERPGADALTEYYAKSMMTGPMKWFCRRAGKKKFSEKDIAQKARQHKPPFPAAPAIGRIILALCMLGFAGAIAYGGWDGVRNGFSLTRLFVRFFVMLFGVKAFDIIGLDYFLITKTQFFQHYIPETGGCAGYGDFGYNRKEQLRQIILIPFEAFLAAWICTLF